MIIFLKGNSAEEIKIFLQTSNHNYFSNMNSQEKLNLFMPSLLLFFSYLMLRKKSFKIFFCAYFRYDRVEVLSGFINGLFLVVIAIFVFAEAFTRLFEPPEVKTERLLVSDGVKFYPVTICYHIFFYH